MQRLNDLFEGWLHAKEREKTAAADRIFYEEEILKLIPTKEDGQITITHDDFKLVAKGSINRKIDSAKWEEIKDTIPEAQRPVEYETVLKLNTKKLAHIKEHSPLVYIKFTECLTEKPNKTNITIERI